MPKIPDQFLMDDELDIEAIFQNANQRARYHSGEDIIQQCPVKLQQFYADFTAEAADFVSGELLTWKPAMKNRAIPHYGQPCVFMRYVPYEESMVSPNGFLAVMDTVDMECAAYDDEGDIMIFMADSRRMQAWTEGGTL